jgi:MFS family permease
MRAVRVGIQRARRYRAFVVHCDDATFPIGILRVNSLFGWWQAGDARARRALIAASAGWMLDAFDVMLYALVIPSVIKEFGLTKGEAGILGSVTLLAAAGGGIAFGFISDRFGRTRALMGSVLIYSVATALCGLSQNLLQLLVFRTILGVGMGGEWASGAALVSESWPDEHRGKALGFMQSAWAIGYGLAAAVTAIVLPTFGWRAVFFVGVLPAVLTIWVRRHVEEPELWQAQRRAAASTPRAARASLADAFKGRLGRTTIAVTAMNACTLFGWWGLNTWIPSYLSLPADKGGIGFSSAVMSGLIIAMQVGMWLGYVTFGFISDALGRKRTYVAYLLAASVLLPLYGVTHSPWLLLGLGPLVAFFGTGYYSGFGALTAELYPTAIRGAAQGFTYNTGRIASAAAPFTVGSLAASRGFASAFAVTGAAFFLAAIIWRFIPETKGRTLT